MRLKDIAQEVGVSPAYLSQVRHGKRPPSAELSLKLNELGVEKLSKIKQPVGELASRQQSYQDCALTS